jgi:type I restriction-modification system DNA methylase subunit
MPKIPAGRERFEKELAVLVDKFSQREDEYKRVDYTESQARVDFIDPFFEALGWDVRNVQGLARQTRQVIVERGETRGHPDYNFRLNGQTQFFVEAKAPHVLLDSSNVILQAKKYAFNETSQMVLLAAATDFEEFRLYEVRDISYLRRVNKGLIFTYRYDEYLTPKALDDLWKLARESVAAGSLDALITPAARRERQRIPLDQQFLSDLVEWREKLAKAVFKAHHDLEAEDLNSVVQVFLDRLIFIRVAEDRGVLPENQLREIARHWREDRSRPIIAELLPLFRAVNQKLNGEIFKPHRADEINWDSALVAEIIDDGLEPYNFAQIGVELLGSIYERYLGKTIRVTETRAIVEEKPEVRKAGGVYYTPKYIVDYIVAQTVGKLIEGKTPKQIEKLKMLDPACGSGSFLLGAYQALLDYHMRYYTENAKKKKAEQPRLIDAAESGEFRLSLEDKAAILRNNIFGVDIDPQAVEITMMSLYIKMLEGERGAIAGQGVLPRLRDNIKCGNSLIGYDIGALSAEDKERINPFDWNSKSEGFGEIMAAGGFDAVVGNPPYGAELLRAAKKYLSEKYPLVSDFETSQYFIAESEKLAKRGGYVSFIIPNTLFLNLFALKFRQFILNSYTLQRVTNLSEIDVFEGATVRTVIPILVKGKGKNPKVDLVLFQNPQTYLSIGTADQRRLIAEDKTWITALGNPMVAPIRDKIVKVSAPLGEILEISQGLIPYDKYRGHDENTIKNRIWHSDKKKDKTYRRELRGGDVTRYSVEWNGKQWISYGPWLAAPRKPKFFTEPRILFREITDPRTGLLHVAYTEEEYYNNPGIINCVSRDTPYSLKYLLGLVASRLMAHWHFSSSPKARKGVFPKILVNDVRNLPIRTINFSDPAGKSRHDKMVALVERMLNLHKHEQAAKSDATRERIEREINVTDEQIDALVYELYGLTKEEIKIVEAS